MSEILLLTADGHRAPPSSFVKRLEAFDGNLRVVWGFGQGKPFPGWVIERRIPNAMKALVYGGATGLKPANRERYADQGITDDRGNRIGGRRFDMMPDWHPVYRVVNEDGDPIMELGEHVIDYLRRNYARTLLGQPQLSSKHHAEDLEATAQRKARERQELIDRAARKVMEHRYDNTVFPENAMGFKGSRGIVKEGTEL